jgi:DNA replication and repair protein RecF
MIQYEESWAEVQGEVTAAGRSLHLRAVVSRQGKRQQFLNGVAGSAAEIFRLFPVVSFWPSDVVLVHGEPLWRRRFLDAFLARLAPGYLADLRAYRRALLQRNVCLRRDRSEGIEVWEEELARYGSRLIRERLRILERLRTRAEKNYSALAGGSEELTIRYSPVGPDPQACDLEQELLELLRRGRPADRQAGYTRVGPHRDQLELLVQAREARSWSSRGQQKEVAVALRLAQAQVTEEILGRKPLLLLDDIFAEFDARRREWLGEVLESWPQVVVTATETLLLPRRWSGVTAVEVKGGEIRPLPPAGL